MKVLVVKTSSMGDVIHAFPAVTDALRARPDLTVDWCVEAPFAELVSLHPGISTIHRVSLRGWRKALLSAETWRAVGSLSRALREAKYDLVIDVQGLMKSAFLVKLANAPAAGFDRTSVRELPASLAYAHAYAVPRDIHAIDRARVLFGKALGYEPDLSRLDNGIVAPAPVFPDRGAPTAFLLHGTSRETKKWPVGRWIETAAALAARGLLPLTTWSSPAEKETAEAIAAAVPSTIVIPRSPLLAIAGEIGRARLVIGADTGLMHLASAFALPTVALFVATRPGLTGPIGPRSVALTPEEGDGISVGRVLAAAEEMMGKKG